MKSAPNLSFELHRSRWAVALSIVVSVLALIAVERCGLSVSWRIGIAALVTAVAVFRIAQHVGTRGSHVRLLPDGSWLIRRQDAERTATLERAHDLRFLIALTFRTADRARIDMAIWPDSLATDQRRRLRGWLSRHRFS